MTLNLEIYCWKSFLYLTYFRDACEKYWGEDLKQLVIDRGKNNKGRKL